MPRAQGTLGSVGPAREPSCSPPSALRRSWRCSVDPRVGRRATGRRTAALPLPARGHLRPLHLPAARALAAQPAAAVRGRAHSEYPQLATWMFGLPYLFFESHVPVGRAQTTAEFNAHPEDSPRYFDLHHVVMAVSYAGLLGGHGGAAAAAGPRAGLGAAAPAAGHRVLRLQPLRRVAAALSGWRCCSNSGAAGWRGGGAAGAGRDDEVVSAPAAAAFLAHNLGRGRATRARAGGARLSALPRAVAGARAGRGGRDRGDPGRHLRQRRLGGRDLRLRRAGRPLCTTRPRSRRRCSSLGAGGCCRCRPTRPCTGCWFLLQVLPALLLRCFRCAAPRA
jgi:hypothetical protein